MVQQTPGTDLPPPQPTPSEKPIPTDVPAPPDPQPGTDLPPPQNPDPAPRPIPAAAQRALDEAAARRRAEAEMVLPRELGGRDGPEPVRYGDWEKKGLAVDF